MTSAFARSSLRHSEGTGRSASSAPASCSSRRSSSSNPPTSSSWPHPVDDPESPVSQLEADRELPDRFGPRGAELNAEQERAVFPESDGHEPRDLRAVERESHLSLQPRRLRVDRPVAASGHGLANEVEAPRELAAPNSSFAATADRLYAGDGESRSSVDRVDLDEPPILAPVPTSPHAVDGDAIALHRFAISRS